MKKLSNLILAVIATLVTYYLAPILIIVMALCAAYRCMKCKTKTFLMDWWGLMVTIVYALVRTIGYIAKTGLITEALKKFYKEIEAA